MTQSQQQQSQHQYQQAPDVQVTSYSELLREIEDFLYAEADALDERRFEEWLDFLADDIRYHIPIRKNLPFAERHRDITEENDVAWMNDDKETLTKRVQQIMTGIHWAEEPLSRVSHLVTNVRLRNWDAVCNGSTEFEVGCRILVHRNRLEDHTELLIGRREDVLRRHAGGFRIAHRRVILDQSTLLSSNLTVFL